MGAFSLSMSLVSFKGNKLEEARYGEEWNLFFHSIFMNGMKLGFVDYLNR